MRIESVAAAVALALYAIPALGQVEQRSSGPYVAPLVNAVRTDSDRRVDDDPAFTLAAGFEAHRNWNLESNFFRGRFDAASGGDLTIDALGINALRVFRRDTRIAPFLLAGLGAQRKDQSSIGKSTDAYGDAGAGLLTTWRRSESDGSALFVRLDARARYDDASGGSRIDYLLGLGLQYAFGSTRPERAPPPVTPAAPPQPADEDSDGVLDRADRCAGTPRGRAVDTDGCELDTDADDDSVANDADNCPHTAQGTRVDARGCELAKEIRLPRVSFEYGSDRLQSEAFATLDTAAETLRLNPDLRIEVAGHTDDRGTDSYNLTLSQRRAEAVRRYLVDNGVTNVLTVRGYGEREPIADNGTETGRSANRRVVLRILSP